MTEPVQAITKEPAVIQQPVAAPVITPPSRVPAPKGIVLSFAGDLISDGFRIVGILAPLMSIGFTLFKMFGPADYDLHDVSYAWALAPLLGWFAIAYARRWSHSRMELQRAQDEIAALRMSMDNRAALNTARHRLALLRSVGVKIRNYGLDVKQPDLDAWCAEAEKWNEDVKVALAEIDLAMAEWFATLDAVPPARVRLKHPLDFRHQKLYGEHDFRLHRLDILISDNRLNQTWEPSSRQLIREP